MELLDRHPRSKLGRYDHCYSRPLRRLGASGSDPSQETDDFATVVVFCCWRYLPQKPGSGSHKGSHVEKIRIAIDASHKHGEGMVCVSVVRKLRLFNNNGERAFTAEILNATISNVT